MSTEPDQDSDSAATLPDLGSKDVRFLRAIATVNENYGTPNEKIGAPATTGRIRKVSGLDDKEVQHRLKRSKKVADLIEVYDAPAYEGGQLGPKSAELTDVGEQALAQITSGDLSHDLASPEDLSRVEEELIEIRETLTAIEESPTGALDEDVAENLEALKKMMVTFQRAFEEMGVDLDKHRPDTD